MINKLRIILIYLPIATILFIIYFKFNVKKNKGKLLKFILKYRNINIYLTLFVLIKI